MITHRELYIGGRMIAPRSAETIEVVSPHSEEVVGSVPDGSTADIDAAVAAARAAMNGPWGRSTPAERAAVMRRLHVEYAKRADDLISAQVTEMGIPVSQAGPLMVDGALGLLDYFIGLVEEFPFTETRTGARGTSVVLKKPRGVVAAIVPWNGPTALTMSKLATSLAAGCAMVLKPSPEAPLDAYVLAEAALAAELPDGVLNVVPSGRETGEYLVTHPDVDLVSFTGSVAAGRRIGSLCGELLRPANLELGGKSAAIVLEDADLAATVKGLATNSFINTGQVCMLDSRVLLPASRYDEFADAIVAMVAGFTVGDPFDPATYIGPLVADRQRQRVEEYVRIGIAEGATVATGGGRPAGLNTGWYVEPTVFVDVDNSMRIAREEIFGPVLVLIRYETEDEAVAIANDSDYGLAGSVWTTDTAHGAEVASRVLTGGTSVNAFGGLVNTPFGGVKSSGFGRSRAAEGLSEYLYTHSVFTPAG